MQAHDRDMMFARGFGAAALLGIGYFGFALVLLHLVRDDYEPARHMISDYAVGPYGWLMTSAFLALSLCCLMLALGLHRLGPRSIPGHIAKVLFGIACAGLLLTAAFPTDLPGARATTAGDIHNTTFLINVGSLLLATILLTASLWKDGRWRPIRRVAVALAAFVLTAFVLQFLSLRPGAPYGLANRLFVVALLSWLAAIALRLFALGKTDPRAVSAS